MMFNPMQIMQMMRNGNPHEMVLSMMKNQTGNNPVLKNAVNMAENGDTKGLETLARNLCKEKGIDADSAMSQIKNQFGIK